MGRHGAGGFSSSSGVGDSAGGWGGPSDYGGEARSHHHGHGTFSNLGSASHHWLPSMTGILEGAAVGAAASSLLGRSWGRSGESPNLAPVTPHAVPPSGGSRSRSSCSWWPLVWILPVLAVLYMQWAVYAPEEVELGLHDSRLLQASSLFCRHVKVESMGPQPAQAVLYSLRSPPELAATAAWTERHRVRVQGYGFEDWAFWLNRGSRVKVEYQVPYSSGLLAIVIRSEGRFKQWQNDPQDFDDYEYRKYLSGSGSFCFKASADGDYYVAFGNFYGQPQELAVSFHVESRVYDVSRAVHTCAMPPSRACALGLPFLANYAAVLQVKAAPENEAVWRGHVTYETRWLLPFVLIVLCWSCCCGWLCCCWCCCGRRRQGRTSITMPPPQGSSSAHEQSPLLHSVPSGTPYPAYPPAPVMQWPPSFQNHFAAPQQGGVPPAPPPPPPEAGMPMEPSAPPLAPSAVKDDGKAISNEGSSCVVCFDAPKDAIFDPCGHRATCHDCASRLQQSSSPLCPICRTTITRIIRVFDV